MVLLAFDCTVRLIQEPRVKENPPVMMWSAHDIVVTKVMILISEGVVFVIEKRQAAFVTTVIPLDI